MLGCFSLPRPGHVAQPVWMPCEDEGLLYVCVRRDYLEYLQSLERLDTSNECHGRLKAFDFS